MNLTNVVLTLSWLVTAGFVALAAVAVRAWLRNREPSRRWLALALGSLAVVAVAARVITVLDLRSPAFNGVVVVAFMAAGYSVLRFRDALMPIGVQPLRIALLVAVLATIAGILSTLPGLPPVQQQLLVLGLVAAWAVLTGEPIVRFWLEARSRPRIQRSRMRSLSFAFAVLIAIVVVSGVVGSSAQNQYLQAGTQLLALAMVPVIYISLAPPGWLRSLWRLREEAELQAATRDLLIFSPDRYILAGRALPWAIRLVGADGAFIADSDGTILASENIAPDELRWIQEESSRSLGELVTVRRPPEHTAFVLRLPLHGGSGALGVLAGPFTPVFGTDEIARLEAYASAVSAGIERTRVTERMADMERTKSQFLNLASHELRGPLTIINGYISMLSNGLLGNLNPEGTQAMRVMTAKAAEMNDLVEQMIEAARLEEGRIKLNRQEVDLREVVENAVDHIRPLLGPTHQMLLSLGDSPVMVDVDVRRLQTILTNLLDNAVKYSPRGGDVRCEIAIDTHLAKVLVKDQGVGIDKAGMKVLFTRFGRVATAETANIPGTGLGLYLARELARMHGGDINVESSRRSGTTFSLDVPLVRGKERARVRAQAGVVAVPPA